MAACCSVALTGLLEWHPNTKNSAVAQLNIVHYNRAHGVSPRDAESLARPIPTQLWRDCVIQQLLHDDAP